MAIFYNLGACEVLPHNPGEPYRIKKPYRDFLLLVQDLYRSLYAFHLPQVISTVLG